MKKSLKKVLSVFAVAALVYAGCHLLTYMLQDDTASFTRLMMHEFYNQERIDYLFVGSSLFIDGLDPFLIAEKTGKEVFSASSAGQPPDVSLALIKEAVSLYDIEEIFLEINLIRGERKESFKERSSLTPVYIVSDYLRPSLNKLQLLLNASSPSHFVNSFWPARRYWEEIINLKRIDTIIQKKSTDKYKNFSYFYVNNGNDDLFEYRGKSFTINYYSVRNHEFLNRALYTDDNSAYFPFDWIYTYEQVFDFCEKHKIKLTLISPPISNYELACVDNYEDYDSAVRSLIKSRNIKYIDFNLVSNDYYPYIQTDYMDWHHLNAEGAEHFSSFLADYINNDVPESAFYASLMEKLRSCPSDYYGIFYQDDYENKERDFYLISNDPNYFEYKINFITGSGESISLQDYSVNDKISVPFEMIPDCELIVYFRPSGSFEEGKNISYKYMEPVY